MLHVGHDEGVNFAHTSDMGTGRNKRDGYTGPRSIAKVLDQAMGATTKARGFTQAAVITQWPAIVGESWARDCAPQKLVFPRGERSGATLHIRTPGSVAIELQHVEPVLIERINRYFGFRAVARRRSPRPGRFPTKRDFRAELASPRADPGAARRARGGSRRRPIGDDASGRNATPGDRVTAIADTELRGALLDLGRGVARNKAAQHARAAKRNV